MIALVGAGATFALGLVKFNLGANAGTCLADGEIEPAKRSDLENASLVFARGALGDKPRNAYALMTKEARSAVSAEKFAADMTVISRMGPFSGLRLARTYLL